VSGRVTQDRMNRRLVVRMNKPSTKREVREFTDSYLKKVKGGYKWKFIETVIENTERTLFSAYYGKGLGNGMQKFRNHGEYEDEHTIPQLLTSS